MKKVWDTIEAEIKQKDEIIAELLEVCKRLLKFNKELCEDVNVSTHYPSAEFARQAIAKTESGLNAKPREEEPQSPTTDTK